MRTGPYALVAVYALLTACGSAIGEDSQELAAALGRSILPPGQAVREVKSFVQQRIIAPPTITDRAQWEKIAANLRAAMFDQVVFRGTAAAWRHAPCRVEWLDTIAGGPGYSIQKFRYEALPGMWIPGLLYRPDALSKNVPLAVHVNGHAPEGKAVDYKQLRSINLAKRGMLVLNLEWFGMGQLRTPGFSHYRLNQLDLCGASGLAPFYLAMSRALDLGLKLEHVDPARVAVSGLSGGGWQTILLSSLDERVTLANPVAGYGSFHTNVPFDDLGDSEQAPSDMAVVADYAHLTAMRAPRPTLLTYNAGDDCCFRSGHTLEPLLQAARPAFAAFGAQDRLRSHVNHVPGTHNFERENREQYYAMLADFFYPGESSFARSEIASEAELKTAAQLEVPLPGENLDFHRLAEQLASGLRRQPKLPTDRAAAEAWQLKRRGELRALLRVPDYQAAAEKLPAADSPAAAIAVEHFRLTLNDAWTIPVVEIRPAGSEPAATRLVVADAGRASVAAETKQWVAAGERVIAIDPLLWGESKLKGQDPDFLFPLLVAAVGERPLGIQTAQLAAVARWIRSRQPQTRLTLSAIGPRASAAALVAAALRPAAFDHVNVNQSLASLHELIEQDKTVETLPELFAFGLLAEFDIWQWVALAAPLRVTFADPAERARRELATLPAWYALWDVAFQPAP